MSLPQIDPNDSWVHRKGDRYIPIGCSASMNQTGHGLNYWAIANTYTSHAYAMHQGFTLTGSDDFNIGVLRKGRLVALLWMHEVVDDDPAVLARIAEQALLA